MRGLLFYQGIEDLMRTLRFDQPAQVAGAGRRRRPEGESRAATNPFRSLTRKQILYYRQASPAIERPGIGDISRLDPIRCLPMKPPVQCIMVVI
ncbi:hypothetical protein AAY24_07100 [Sedimenticola thiotaurini]|uniref:Uncharacterized protein n=1 Tax=Sedimenticola thiotaurini TaxID=1543721 RepID=A0A0F7JUC7_9GAMM|nr:hypothetical protein AAY24_07100 [Sedimenticola thiotaurini]